MRAIWSGAITFGLVSIPIKLYTAVSSDRISFDMLHEKDGGKIHYKRVCEKDGKEVPYEDIVKGYEYSPGEYVTFTSDELDDLDVDTMQTIEIDAFVDVEEIDPIFYDKTYYVSAQKGGEKAYRLLVGALKDQGRVGVAKFALRQKEHLTALRVKDDMLVVQTMHWPAEIREPDFGIDGSKFSVRAQEREMASELVDKLTGPFEPERYRNEFERKLKAAAKRKIEGKEIVRAPQAKERKVEDLMQALQASLDAATGKGSGKPAPSSGGAKRFSRKDLEEMSKSDLYEIASEREIEGRSEMTKDELAKALAR